MKSSRLIQFLNAFTEKEIKDFGKFLRSPYFSDGRKYSSLYTEIVKYGPGLSECILIKRNLI